MDTVEKYGKLGKLAMILPQMSPTEQELSIELYRLLSAGRSVSIDALAEKISLSGDAVSTILNSWPGVKFDERESIVGYWGLTLRPTSHEIHLASGTLYAWCAWDTLFLPELLGESARIESRCPVTAAPVSMKVSAAGVDNLDPPGTVVSFVLPPENEIRADIVKSFCQYVHFFPDADIAAEWAGRYDNAFTVSVDEAYQTALEKNCTQYAAISDSDQ